MSNPKKLSLFLVLIVMFIALGCSVTDDIALWNPNSPQSIGTAHSQTESIRYFTQVGREMNRNSTIAAHNNAVVATQQAWVYATLTAMVK